MHVNPYIAIPLVAWLISQWIKFSIAAFKGNINFRYLYASGGMPSVHSAVTTSLATTALIREGGMSPLFGVTAVFAAIVMYDSLGVRRSTGEQATVLNALLDGLQENKISFTTPISSVREVLGHQPREVLWGAILGFAVAVIAQISMLTKQLEWLKAVPSNTEILVYTIVFAMVTLSLAAVLIIHRHRWRKSDQQNGHLLTWLALGLSIVGLFISLAQYETAAVLSSRAWTYAIFVGLLLLAPYIMKAFRMLPSLSLELPNDRKSRWLNKARAKRRK